MAHTCTCCNGTGKMVCPRCWGSGKLNGSETCYYCKGEGKVQCRPCGGSGKIED